MLHQHQKPCRGTRVGPELQQENWHMTGFLYLRRLALPIRLRLRQTTLQVPGLLEELNIVSYQRGGQSEAHSVLH